jgi:hypothetical protein
VHDERIPSWPSRAGLAFACDQGEGVGWDSEGLPPNHLHEQSTMHFAMQMGFHFIISKSACHVI